MSDGGPRDSGHESAKVAPRLAERIDELRPPDWIEVLIELVPDGRHRLSGSRPERLRAARSSFEVVLAAISASIHAVGGEVLETAWVNHTVRSRIPAGGIAAVAEEDVVATVDLPRRLEPEG